MKGGEPMTKLKEVRQAKGISQSHLADAALVSRPFMCDLEHDRRVARLDTWERIAGVLECDVTEILSDAQLERFRGVAGG